MNSHPGAIGSLVPSILLLALTAPAAEPPAVKPVAPPAVDSAPPAVDSPPAQFPVAAEHVTVTVADRRTNDLDRTTAAAAVLTDTDDRRGGRPLSWWQRLVGVPGVDAHSLYGGMAGDDVQVALRGGNAADVQLTLDGIPLEDATAIKGDLNPGLVPVAGLDRIEIAKGAQSGLYGSRALAGIIALTSRQPGKVWEGSGRLSAGSFRTATIDLAASGPVSDRLGVALSVSALRSQGFSSQTDADAHGEPRGHERDGVARGAGNLRLVLRPAAGLELYAAAMGAAVNQDYDGFDPATFMPDPDDGGSRTRSRLGRLAGGGSWKLGPATIAVDAARTTTRRTYAPSNTDPSHYRGNDDQILARADTSWTPAPSLQFSLAGGGDGRHSKAIIDDRTYGGSLTRREGVGGGWLSAGAANDHLELSATGRQDWHSREGDERTWRLGAAWWPLQQLPPDLSPGSQVELKLRSAIGTAFRAPSLYELHDPTYGDPTLLAQRSRSWEYGAEVRFAGWGAIEVTSFRQRSESVISYDPATFRTTNLRGATIRGIEAGIRLEPDCCGLRASLAFTRLRDNAEGSAVARQASRRWVIDLGWQEERWWLGGRVERAASRYWNNPYGESGLPGYTLYSANARWQIHEHFAVTVRGENLAGETYEVTPGYSTAPRSCFAGVEASF
ncbi:ligand-gated channel [Planctomycetota bacterium]|nr:ligand-gated channel [Planctomycetota bacterium]